MSNIAYAPTVPDDDGRIHLGCISPDQFERVFKATDETAAQEQLRLCLTNILQGVDPISTMLVTGELIEYSRDYVLSGLAAVRRMATVTARITMSPDEIARATNLSRATVSRLITEYREP